MKTKIAENIKSLCRLTKIFDVTLDELVEWEDDGTAVKEDK